MARYSFKVEVAGSIPVWGTKEAQRDKRASF